MDFYQELLLTAIFSILFALLLGKISYSGGGGGGGGGGDRPEAAALAADLGLGRIEEEEEEGVVVDPRGTPVVAAADRAEAAEVEDLEERGEEKGPEIALEEGSGRGRSREEEKGLGDDLIGVGEIPAEESNDAVEIERVDSESVRQQDYAEKLGLMAEGEEGEEEVGGSLLHGEDEWEGIERSELEEHFRVAVKYVESEAGSETVSKLSSDSQMKLYGLYKVATEGPCFEPQPMALKLSARAKWNAWQALGSINPEVAMEQYLTLLSGSIPEWMGEKPREAAKDSDGNDSLGSKIPATETPDLSSALHQHPDSAVERLLDDSSHTNVDDEATGPKLSNLGMTKNFLFNLLSPTRVTFLTFYL